MKTLFITVITAALGAALYVGCAPAEAQTCTPLEVHNLVPGRGTLMLAVYASADEFRKKTVAAVQMRAGDASSVRFPFCLAGAGPVALVLFQDLNDNGSLDANVLGIPSEPWGASGSTPPMSAPTWASAQVLLDGSTVVVKLSQ